MPGNVNPKYRIYYNLHFLLDNINIKSYYKDRMLKHNDKELIGRFVKTCARQRMTLEDMGRAVGRTKGWASMIINGKVKTLRFCTRNRVLEFLGEL